MVKRDEIEQIAAVWARRESLHRGYECTPVLGEFDVGYTVYATPLPQERGVPGDGSTTIIDKATGDIYATNGTPPPIGATVGVSLNLHGAREFLSRARLELSRVREPGDPRGGTPARPCESCGDTLVHFGVLRSPGSATAQESPAPRGLTVRDAIDKVVAVAGATHRYESVPAAERALAAYPDFVSDRRGLGGAVRTRPFAIAPTAVAQTADTLADFGTVLGARLFPIGTEEDDSILAVDEHGRVFALDQAGEWFLGADIDEALTNLLRGRAVPKIRNDGTW
jgi:hypothetical protein